MRNACYPLAAALILLGACASLTAQAPVAEVVPAPAPAAEPTQPECKEESLFANMPPITPFPRVGLSLFPPAGEGYYSLVDRCRGEWREKPPQYPYPRYGFIQFSFFDADWRYLDKPDNTEHDFFDCLKRIRVGDCALFTTGGDFRVRYASETSSRLTGRDNTYELIRTRVYGDLSLGDRLRIYGEFLDAQSFNEDLDPLPIDEDRSDLLNLFAEVNVCEVAGKPVWVRVGRQELLYGSQRLISTLDWANTRRTFQGVKA